MRLLGIVLMCAVALTACESHKPTIAGTARIARGNAPRHEAAEKLMQRYAQSAMSEWKMRASASGADCGVLLIETALPMDSATIEAMHYGAAAYDFLPGGVNRFRREHAFRGVAYRDSSGHVWEYGKVTAAEVQRPVPCG